MHLTEFWMGRGGGKVGSGRGRSEWAKLEGENKSICPHQKPYARGRINHRCINSCCGSCSEYSLKPDPGIMTVQAILILKLYSILLLIDSQFIGKTKKSCFSFYFHSLTLHILLSRFGSGIGIPVPTLRYCPTTCLLLKMA
jgi:hypothetical protein